MLERRLRLSEAADEMAFCSDGGFSDSRLLRFGKQGNNCSIVGDA